MAEMTPLEIMAQGFLMNAAAIEKGVRLPDLTDDERAGLLKAALQALDAAGWVVVPKEATEEMLDRFVSRALQVSIANEGGWSAYGRNQYKAMIEAGAYKV